MADSAESADPSFPCEIPLAVVVLLAIAVAVLTLALIAAVVGAVFGSGFGPGFDLSFPEGPIQQMVWVQSGLTLIAGAVVWIFGILVVASYAQGSQREAAGFGVVFVRISIAVILVRFVASAALPGLIGESWSAALVGIASGAPLVLAQIALLICADAWLSAVRQNAAA